MFLTNLLMRVRGGGGGRKGLNTHSCCPSVFHLSDAIHVVMQRRLAVRTVSHCDQVCRPQTYPLRRKRETLKTREVFGLSSQSTHKIQTDNAGEARMPTAISYENRHKVTAATLPPPSSATCARNMKGARRRSHDGNTLPCNLSIIHY